MLRQPFRPSFRAAFRSGFIRFICGLSLLISQLGLALQAQAGEVHLYAASSLTDALTALSEQYEKSHPQVKIIKSFAGSAALAKQIENGAPADVFISADNDWADYLQERGFLVNASRKPIAGNQLVLVAPLANPIKVVFSPDYNLGEKIKGRLCTGDVTSVPVGRYAKQALVYYQWWDAMAPRIVGSADVRAALSFIERAECELGIIYKTDALLSAKVKIVGIFPSESHKKIEYPSALTKNATKDSQEFFEFLHSKQARPVFLRFGFVVL